MKLSRLFFSVGFVFLISLSVFAGDAPPTWLRQASSVSTPVYDKEVRAVALYYEQQVTLDSGGRVVTTENYAVRILSREGRKYAAAVAFYLVKFSKVREMEGWLIRPDGSIKSYGKKDIIDRISDPNNVYDEEREKIIDASGDADTGYVFGYSIVSEDKPLFYQDMFIFQDMLPTLVSRYTLNLPAGWTASGVTFNHPEIKPQTNGTTYTWELRNLAPIHDEPLSPSFINIAPRIAVNYSPVSGSQAVSRAFADWAEVSRWATEMFDPQVIVNDEVAAKAQELTAGAKTEMDKIRAVGTFVQNLQYISIDIGVGYGNGMRPRPSSLVLSRGYGDCKDKATLMRAMLKALKIESYPVAIYSGDPDFVRREWVSPRQFNHCIIAIKISDSTTAATVINHNKLGRLLIFDATDQFTPVGDLPDYEQGSLALIIAGDKGDLVEMPVTPPEFNAWKREIEVNLTSDGHINGVIREKVSGQESRYPRTMFRSLSGSDFNKVIEGWLARGATAANLVKLTPKDRHADAVFELDVEFTAPRYGQLMQDRLLVFKPAIVNRTNSIYLTEKSRKHPVVIDSNSFNEKVIFNLPQGFTVDEVPDAVNLETPFGKYVTNYEIKDGKLFFSRSLTTTRTTVPVEKYSAVRDFYARIRDVEQSPVVLLRK